MRIHPLDNSLTEHSPCNDCKHHKQGIDKTKCLINCKRLAAYRDQEDWSGIPEMTTNEVDEDIKQQHEQKVKSRYGKKAIMETKPQITELNKDMPGICIMNGCTDEVYSRDLCKSCYGKYIYGSLDHPVHGKFVRKYYKTGKMDGPRRERIKEERRIATKVDLCNFNWNKYPHIRDAILKKVEESMLPAEHIIMGILSNALIERGRT